MDKPASSGLQQIAQAAIADDEQQTTPTREIRVDVCHLTCNSEYWRTDRATLTMS